ncbi:DUF7529 family protein [Halorussus halobius]|uniref:DUF7529 family protein n=1 Tax=Halorussus halobius TaxID=1710537 RepID=UPI001091D31D|nr:hypothetical protein [Halorussus halobius]
MADSTRRTRNGWARTLAAASEMETDLREDGYDVVTVRAGHVEPELPRHGDTDEVGLVYVAQGDVADPLGAAVERGSFDSYRVFSRRSGSDLYALTRVTDADRRQAVLLVGAVDLARGESLASAARSRGAMHSHVHLLDGTRVASFVHDDPTAFFPEET